MSCKIEENIYKENCKSCKGKGYFQCFACSGGSIRCSNCFGTGMEDDSYKKTMCNNCFGRGSIDCYICKSEGKEICKVCSGHGKL